MSRRLHAVLLVVPAVFAFAGCSDNADAPPPYSSGVDGNTQLTNLTPSEKTQICTTQTAFVKARIDTTSLTRFWCAFTPAVFGAANDDACEAALDQCVRAFSVKLDVTVTDPNAPPPQCIIADQGQCNGTVADYEGCVNALAQVEVSVGVDFACGHRTEHADNPTVGVAACDAVGPKCTGVTATPR